VIVNNECTLMGFLHHRQASFSIMRFYGSKTNSQFSEKKNGYGINSSVGVAKNLT